jgi:hypothetical protein
VRCGLVQISVDLHLAVTQIGIIIRATVSEDLPGEIKRMPYYQDVLTSELRHPEILSEIVLAFDEEADTLNLL